MMCELPVKYCWQSLSLTQVPSGARAHPLVTSQMQVIVPVVTVAPEQTFKTP